MKKFKPNYDEGMWKGAPKESFSKAWRMRYNPTDAEKILWECIRSNRVNGLKFRRQHPVSLYIADFYCHQLKLVIEVDGDYHSSKEQVEKDKERTDILNSNGLEVLRFSNKEILENIDLVLKSIELKAEEILSKTKNSNQPIFKRS